MGALWNDRFGAGNLLALLDDGQLYYADDTRTVPNGQNASWRCIDPTPGDPTDMVSWVESVRGSGQYLVATNASTSSGDVGAVYLVNLGTSVVAPGPCGGNSPSLNVTTAIAGSAGYGRINTLASDPARDDYSFYATLIPASGKSNALRVIHAVNDAPGAWTVTGIAPPGNFLATTLNAWTMETPWKGIVVDPFLSNTVYVNTDNGLMVGERKGTDDSTWTWRQTPGVPQTYVTGLSVRRSGKGIVRASTYGRSVWEHSSDMCDDQSPVIKLPDPVIKLPIPRPDPELPVDTLSFPVSYRLDGRTGGQAVLRVAPTIHGKVAHGFLSEGVPIRKGFNLSLPAVIYAGADADVSVVTDGLFVQIASRTGEPIATRHFDATIAWRRPDMRSLWLSADVPLDGEAIHPRVPIRIQETGTDRQRTARTRESVQLAAGSTAVVSAPAVIQLREGTARFHAWDYAVAGDARARHERPIVPSRSGATARIRMDDDTVLIARYKVRQMPEVPELA